MKPPHTHDFPFLLTATGDDPDYMSRTDVQLTLSSSQMEAFINVSINDDSIFEADERFTASLSLGIANDRVIISPDQAEVTILDNDGTWE